MEKVLVSWSGGKDSAFALSEIIRDGRHHISALLTTLSEEYDRISMHGVRRTLLEQQAAALGLPLEKVFIPRDSDNTVYESRMKQALEHQKRTGISAIVFGDILLEDLRRYREEKLASLSLRGLFPIWKRETRELVRSFITAHFKAIVTCVDTHVLDARFVGRIIDTQFLAELPESVDPCGENGEYHSFVFHGPIFKKPVAFRRGETVLRDQRFCYCDLIPS